MAEAFFFSLYGSLQHFWMRTFGKDNALRMEAYRLKQVLRKLRLLAHQFAKALAIGLPVGNGRASYAAIHRSFGHSHRNFCDEAGIDGFRNEISGAKGEVAYLVSAIDDIGNGTAGQLGNSSHGGHLHFFVDGASCCV